MDSKNLLETIKKVHINSIQEKKDIVPTGSAAAGLADTIGNFIGSTIKKIKDSSSDAGKISPQGAPGLERPVYDLNKSEYSDITGQKALLPPKDQAMPNLATPPKNKFATPDFAKRAGAGGAGLGAFTLGSSPAGENPPTTTTTPPVDRSKQDLAMKVAGVERQNPIVKPGNLESGNLKLGSRGDSVRELQRKLGIKDDGIFGPQTAAALKKSQQEMGIKSDAIYGTQTKSAFDRAAAMNKLRSENPGFTKTLPGTSAETPTAQKMYQKNYNRDRMESTDMPSKIIEAFMKLHSKNPTDLFAEAKKAKKLDAVGKEDEDIDNDGDKDKSDSYLHNRRKKIAAAMKEAIDPKVRPPVKKDPYGGDETSPSSMGIDKPDYAPAGTTPDYAKPKLKPSVVKQTGKNSSEVYKQQAEEVEEVEFSEAELEHFAAILETLPVGPTPAGYDVNAFGSSTSRSGTLTDEAIAEEEKKKRGRKPGVKVGAYGPRGAKKGEGEATTNVSVPHVFHQIRTSRADSQGNYNLQHEHGGKTLNAKVSARDAAEFSKKYMNTEKPREKEAHTDAFVAKHFGVSKPKAAGITLPKMPSAKS